MHVAIAAVWPEPRRSFPAYPVVLQLRPGRPEVSMEGEKTNDFGDLITAIAVYQDREAFAAVFGYFAPRIKSMIMRMGAPADLSEDIAQEALLSVWRKAASYDSSKASASAWIYAIARNLRIDRARGQKRADTLANDFPEPDAQETPDRLVDAAEREQRVRLALRALPDEQIRVVELSFFEGLAHADISNRLGIPLGTVKSRLRLALRRLSRTLGDLT